MIDMKSFLICESEFADITITINSSGIDALAKVGNMFHISATNTNNSAEFNSYLSDNSNINLYTEFSHSFSSINSFMILLQNVFSGLLIAFSAVLILICFIVFGLSISSVVEQDYMNFGILKVVVMSSKTIINLQLLFYIFALVFGGILGIALSTLF